MKLSSKSIILLFTLTSALLLTTVLSISSAKLEKLETEVEKHKKKKSKVHSLKARTHNKQLPPLQMRDVNDTLKNSTYRNLNYTFDKMELNDFKTQTRKWDYKMFDAEISAIFEYMYKATVPSSNYKTVFNDRAFIEIFLNEFYNSDANKDNLWDLTEMTAAFKNDSYISHLLPPSSVYAVSQNNTVLANFIIEIFNVIDQQKKGVINFNEYMELRLYVFSWRKCSVLGPFIEEANWECAIEVVAGYKTNSRTTLRNTYYMIMDLVNASTVRNIDFITYIQFASTARLYARINGKQDNDISCKIFI